MTEKKKQEIQINNPVVKIPLNEAIGLQRWFEKNVLIGQGVNEFSILHRCIQETLKEMESAGKAVE